MNRRITLIVLGIIALIVVPLGIWGIISFSQRGTEQVTLLVLPGDALVKINDEEYKAKTSVRLEAGVYTATVSKEGFEADTQELLVEKGKDATLISLLTPVSSDTKRWVTNNQSRYLEAEGKAGELANQQGLEIIERYPVTKWLPLQKATYVIGYKQISNGGIAITITASEGYREAAIQEIRDRGYNPGDYVIEFNDYRNPFNE